MPFTVRYKRIYDFKYDKSFGYVAYIDKMFPRGLHSDDERLKNWIKGVAPSYDLIEWFHVDPKHRWHDFYVDYYKELKNSYKTDPEFKSKIDSLLTHPKVTLLYSSRDEIHNDARVLARFLSKRKSEK